MKIDVFNHFLPKRFFDEFINGPSRPPDIGKRVRNIPTLVDLDARFRVMDEFGDYRQLISLPLPPIEILAGPDQSPLLAKSANEELSELTQRYPERFLSFVAALPLNNPGEAEKEAVRAVTQLAACGVQFYSNAAGKPLDSPEFLPLFQELERRDIPIWIHPARGADSPDYRSEDRSKFEIWWTLGWPYETSAAMARLVFSGLFDRCPKLKIITHHMGGIVPYLEGRVGHGWDQLGTRTSQEDLTVLLRTLKKGPSIISRCSTPIQLYSAPRPRRSAASSSSESITPCLLPTCRLSRFPVFTRGKPSGSSKISASRSNKKTRSLEGTPSVF